MRSTNGFYVQTPNGICTVNISITERYTNCINLLFFRIGIGRKLKKAYIRIEPFVDDFYDENVVYSITKYLKSNSVSGFKFLSRRMNSGRLSINIAANMGFERKRSYFSKNSIRLYRPIEKTRYFKFLSK